MKQKLRQPIKRHGGKAYLAEKIIGLMPPRAKNPNNPAADDPGWCHYVEPYFGGGAVLLAQDPEGISEVVNDIDGDLTNFWYSLKDDHQLAQFQRFVEATPCSQVEFEKACKRQRTSNGDHFPCVHCAVDFFIINRQSRQALGKDFATLTRNRTRRGMNELASAWLSAIDGLPEVHARLQRVVILNDKAVEVIKQQDGKRTLFYLDPPYIHSERTVTDAYEHEMTEQQHADLMALLLTVDGRFLLSGYRSKLYDDAAIAGGWTRHDFLIDNKAASGKSKRKMVECVWVNY